MRFRTGTTYADLLTASVAANLVNHMHQAGIRLTRVQLRIMFYSSYFALLVLFEALQRNRLNSNRERKTSLTFPPKKLFVVIEGVFTDLIVFDWYRARIFFCYIDVLAACMKKMQTQSPFITVNI